MKRAIFLAGAALALTSAWAIAQEGPESLLPPGFDEPAPPPPARTPPPAPSNPSRPDAPADRPATSGSGSSSSSSSSAVTSPAVGAIGSGPTPGEATTPATRADALKNLSLEQLEKMSPEELEDALGLDASYDVPASQRRSLDRIGVIAEDEGGLGAVSLAGQDGRLVRAALAGNSGRMVSRWGHIVLRRALTSRLSAPARLDAVDFAALRAALLVRMGEGEAARALVQDVDGDNFNDRLADAALDAYALTFDFTGACPIALGKASARKEPRWQVSQNICRAFRGESTFALRQLDRATGRELMPRVDMLLAQRYAGAAGKARRAVTIEWDGIRDMTPWRYGLTLAVGLEPPRELTSGDDPVFDYMAATAPMLGPERRVQAADRAAGAGILSSAAMVDIYGQLYALDGTEGEWAGRADTLRDAYVVDDPGARLLAIQNLWNSAGDPAARYGRQVLTAFAAARLPASAEMADNAADLIASMLAAGLDGNALRWSGVVDEGSRAWALLALADPSATNVDSDGVDTFISDDDSAYSRKSAFLVAGLAGLGRIDMDTAGGFADDLGIDLQRQTRWSRLIDQAAAVRNPALVALLAGVGMQGDGWDKMTARHLYHIVSALNRVGMGAEARMIAAEAVARG